MWLSTTPSAIGSACCSRRPCDRPRRPRPGVLGAVGRDPAGRRGPPHARAGLGQRPGAAVRHVAARLHEAPQGAGGCRPGGAGQGRSDRALRAGATGAGGCRHVAGSLREVLAGAPGRAGPVPLSPGGSEPMAQGPIEQQKPELRLSRTYPVAVEKVWRAWTDPQALSQWFGPGEVNSVLVAEMDVRAGGKYRIRFRAEGGEHEVAGV